jgi:hypothetical protein
MKANLMKHKPKDLSPAKFEEMWENQGYSLQPLHDYLNDVIKSIAQVTESDFNTPNHYAKWSMREGKRALAQEIQALLPKSCTE